MVKMKTIPYKFRGGYTLLRILKCTSFAFGAMGNLKNLDLKLSASFLEKNCRIDILFDEKSGS